jgi:hypothetical protein
MPADDLTGPTETLLTLAGPPPFGPVPAAVPLIPPAGARRTVLAQEHRDLDETIALLADGASPDEALITRLKKRKLRIKDEIVRLDAKLAA